MTPKGPMIHRDRDLKGATPETLARALLRRRESARERSAPVVRDEVPVEEPVADKAGDRVPHLDERS